MFNIGSPTAKKIVFNLGSPIAKKVLNLGSPTAKKVLNLGSREGCTHNMLKKHFLSKKFQGSLNNEYITL